MFAWKAGDARWKSTLVCPVPTGRASSSQLRFQRINAFTISPLVPKELDELHGLYKSNIFIDGL